MTTTGKCLCGAVSYEVSGDAVFGGHCYCNDCRRTSSSHTSVVAYPIPAVKVSGNPKEYTSKGDSGLPVTRGFCANCGTQMYSKAEGLPGMMLIKAGTLDHPENFKPAMSIYASRAPSWDQPATSLPSFPEMPPPNG
ncbi:MAG: GFA family protein [Terricaulis sp.]